MWVTGHIGNYTGILGNYTGNLGNYTDRKSWKPWTMQEKLTRITTQSFGNYIVGNCHSEVHKALYSTYFLIVWAGWVTSQNLLFRIFLSIVRTLAHETPLFQQCSCHKALYVACKLESTHCKSQRHSDFFFWQMSLV